MTTLAVVMLAASCELAAQEGGRVAVSEDSGAFFISESRLNAASDWKGELSRVIQGLPLSAAQQTLMKSIIRQQRTSYPGLVLFGPNGMNVCPNRDLVESSGLPPAPLEETVRRNRLEVIVGTVLSIEPGWDPNRGVATLVTLAQVRDLVRGREIEHEVLTISPQGWLRLGDSWLCRELPRGILRPAAGAKVFIVGRFVDEAQTHMAQVLAFPVTGGDVDFGECTGCIDRGIVAIESFEGRVRAMQ